MNVKLKRAYAQPEAADGTRILVERLWPRGLTKAKARVDRWMKEVAPSTALRKWFDHDPDKWTEFKRRYRTELRKNDQQVELLKKEIGKRPATLVYGAKDEEHNAAIVLLEFLGY